MKVELIFDKTKEIKDGKIFHNDSDYIDAYLYIKEAINKNADDIKVIVYKSSLKNWLSKELSKYSNKNISIEKKSINFKNLIEDRFNIKLDIEISDTDIKDLLDIADIKKSSNKKSLTDFISEIFISPLLNANLLDKFDFGKFISDLVEFSEKKSQYPDIIRQIQKIKIDKFQRLLDKHPSYRFIKKELANTDKLYNKLATYKIVKNYNSMIKESCMCYDTELINNLDNNKLNLDNLILDKYIQDRTKINKIIDEIDLYINKIKANVIDKNLIENLVDSFSGYLINEFDYIEEILKSKPNLINKNIINKIVTKFLNLNKDISNKIAQLKDLIEPQLPEPFSKHNLADIDNIINWAINQYLPYKFWMENSGIVLEEILEYGNQFSDYIFENYLNFSNNHKNMIFRFFYNYKELINKTDYPIILIIDNFNYKYFEKLKISFNKRNIKNSNESPYICMLPTETSISKHSIISGKREKLDTQNLGYEKLASNLKENFFKDHSIKYISKLGELNNYKIRDDNKELFIINYNRIDEELHNSSNKTAIEHKKQIMFIIDEITDTLARFINNNSIKTKSKIFVVSDHGSTLINKKIKNNIDKEYFKRYLTKDNKSISHRFIKLNKNDFDKIKNNKNINRSLFFLDKNSSGNDCYYLIAKNYDRFIDTDDDFYVHGGALPEEIIIPTAYFEFKEIEIKEITFELLKKEYRFRTKEVIQIRIANPNDDDIKNINIKISSNNRLLLEINKDILKKKSDFILKEYIRINEKSMTNLKILINYNICNKNVKDNFEEKINLKTIATEKFDLDDF